MSEIMDRIRKRFGNKENLEKLTDTQREFLDCSLIKDNVDSGRNQTVSVINIDCSEEPPLLRLNDTFLFMNWSYNPGLFPYQNERISAYKFAGSSSDPKYLGNSEYLFTLKDESKVQIRIDVAKDRD